MHRDRHPPPRGKYTPKSEPLLYDLAEPNPEVFEKLPQWLQDIIAEGVIEDRRVGDPKRAGSDEPPPDFDDDIVF